MDPNRHEDPLFESLRQAAASKQKKAPERIRKALFETPPPLPQDLDAALRQAFAQQNLRRPPVRVWQGIDRQLRLDRVWLNIEKELADPIDFALRQAASKKTLKKAPDKVFQNIQKELAKTSPFSSQAAPKSHTQWRKALKPLFLSLAMLYSQSLGLEKPLVQHQGQGPKAQRLLQNALAQLTTQRPVSKLSVAENSSLKKTKHSTSKPVTVHSPSTKSLQTPQINALPSLKPETKLPSVLAENQPNALVSISPSEVENTKREVVLVQGKMPDYLAQVEPLALELKKPKLSRKPSIRWDLGMVYAYQNAWLDNQKTREAFNSESLVRTDLNSLHQIGFSLGLQLNPQQRLELNFWPKMQVIQEYMYYENGKYNEKLLRFNYRRFELNYALSLGDWGRRFGFYAQTGVYWARLREQYEEREAILFDYTTRYSSYDYGLNLQVGQAWQFGLLQVKYGIGGSLGLHNVVTGEQAPLPNTKLQNLGVFLRFAYKLP